MKLNRFLKQPRQSLAGLALAAGVMIAGMPAVATEWRGGGFVNEFRNCEAGGWPPNMVETIRARYRPSGLPSNGETSRLTLLFNNGSDAYRTRSGRFSGTFTEVDGMGVWSTGYTFDPHPSVRIVQHQPANITANTGRIRIVGIIRNFNGARGCQVRFDVTLTRRPG